MFAKSVFREYDVRGHAGTQITNKLAYAIGRSLGTRIAKSPAQTAAVGRDVRLSSPELAQAAAQGLQEAGLTVFDLGVVPTPVLYHSLVRRDLGGGIMITGSHNPKQDNGLKLCLGKQSFFGKDLQSLYQQIIQQDFAEGKGIIRRLNYMPDYLAELEHKFSHVQGLHVVIDCGNGVMGPVVTELFARLGIRTTELFCEPDGEFPNHIPDPEVAAYMETLGRKVKEVGAHCGLGFDGDGDRVGVLDEHGNKVSADRLLALFCQTLLPQHPGGIVRFDVKCSEFLSDVIRELGGEPWMGLTGHSWLKRDIIERDAILGGELSGHIVFNRDAIPIDDSLFNALKFLEILQRSNGTASALFSLPRLVSTAEVKLACADECKFEIVAELADAFAKQFDVCRIDGARVVVSPRCWFLVRASNTTPNLTVRVEAPTKAQFLEAAETLRQQLATKPKVNLANLDAEMELIAGDHSSSSATGN